MLKVQPRSVASRKIVPAVPKLEDILKASLSGKERLNVWARSSDLAPIEQEKLEKGSQYPVSLPPSKYIPPGK